MEEPPTPPKKGIAQAISAKRQKILDDAFAQLRKSRAKMDPGLINKIRRMIAGNPAMMKSLGLTEALESEPVAKKPPPPPKTPQKVEAKPKPKSKEVEQGGYEKVDQAKNMEVMAKLMALNPNGKDKIKSVIKKAVD